MGKLVIKIKIKNINLHRLIVLPNLKAPTGWPFFCPEEISLNLFSLTKKLQIKIEAQNKKTIKDKISLERCENSV